MGNDNEEMEIRNRHAERVAEIEAMKEEQERQAAIQKLAIENEKYILIFFILY